MGIEIGAEVDCVWNVMSHAQINLISSLQPNKRAHLNRPMGVSSFDCWQPSCVFISGSNAGYAMFRGSVKSTDYPLNSTDSIHFPLVRHCVPSYCNWSLNVYRCTQHYTQIPIPSARVLLIISCFEFLWTVQVNNYSNDYVYGARVEVIMARSSGEPRNFVGGLKKFFWEQRTDRTGIWGR